MLNNVLTSLSHIYLGCFVVWKLKKEIFYSLFHPSCFVLSSLKEVPHLFLWHQSLVKNEMYVIFISLDSSHDGLKNEIYYTNSQSYLHFIYQCNPR